MKRSTALAKRTRIRREAGARDRLTYGAILMACATLLAALFLYAVPAQAAGFADGKRAFDAGDYAQAVRLWRRAAWQQNDLLSQVELGKLYSSGKHTARDDTEAYVWYYLASVNPSTLGLSEIARQEARRLKDFSLIERARLFGPMVPSLRNEAHNRIVYILASSGADGQFRLAEIYDERFGEFGEELNVASTPVGSSAAAEEFPGLFTDSARETTTVTSDSSLSDDDRESYALFSGIPRNNAEALAYYIRASKRGHPLATVLESSLKEDVVDRTPGYGKLVIEAALKRETGWAPPFEVYPGGHSDESLGDSDTEVALIAAEKLELRFIQHALRALGYYNLRVDNAPGPGTRNGIRQFQESIGARITGELTSDETVRLIRTAALRGHAISQNALGTMYFKGIGVPVDFVRAREWFQKAADQRYPFALYNLGVIFRDGLGVPVDTTLAASYFMAAKAAGYGSVSRELKQVGWE